MGSKLDQPNQCSTMPIHELYNALAAFEGTKMFIKMAIKWDIVVMIRDR